MTSQLAWRQSLLTNTAINASSNSAPQPLFFSWLVFLPQDRFAISNYPTLGNSVCRKRKEKITASYRDGYGAFRQPKFECDCCEMLVFRVCGVRQNLYVYSLYRNPDLNDWIFDCLLASMSAVQAEDVRASFLFVGDLNGHHLEWLGSTTTNSHGVAAFDFATVSGCDKLVVGPTHARGGTLDLLMTDVPALVRVAVVAPILNSDYSSL